MTFNLSFGHELASLNRKKRQRKLNRLVNNVNRLIKRDKQFKGRYYIKQEPGSQFIYLPDKSGAMFWTGLRFIDRETGFNKVYYSDYWEFLGGIHIYEKMNDFIIKINYGV